MMYAGYVTHIVRKFCVEHLRQIHDGFTPDARHIRESDANVARKKGCYIWTPLYIISYVAGCAIHLTTAKKVDEFCVGGNCYVVHSEHKEYDDAKTICESEGYELAKIQSLKNQGKYR
jgi:hypothetical protein